MKAICIKFKEKDKDITYYTWKIARDKKTAFKFAFGRAMPKDSSELVTSRGLPITITEVEEYEVSEAFPITELSKEAPSQKVSDNGDWLL